jgi:Dolichyl-phosphate-mannose-protein mannosyltransferase
MIGNHSGEKLEGRAKAPLRNGCRALLRLVALTNSQRVRCVLLFSAAVGAVAYCVLCAVAPSQPVPQLFYFDRASSWISTNSRFQSSGCFRLDLEIPGKIKNAWLALATNGGFETIVNGKHKALFFFWRRTAPYQAFLSEGGQKLNTGDPAMEVSYPREYQWKNHDNGELPTFMDLTPDLHPGRNALCVEVESDRTTPAMIVSGEVLLETGQVIPVRSDSGWKAEPVPGMLPQDRWTSPDFPVDDWSRARTLPWQRSFWRLVPEGVYEEPFHGERIRSIATGSITWLEQDFDLTKTPCQGFLRIATDTPYQIWINGKAVQMVSLDPSILAWGPWFIRSLGLVPMDMELDALPDWLDPNNVATLLPGQQSEDPSTRDPAFNTFTQDQQPVSGTAAHPYVPGVHGTTNSAQGDRPQGENPYSELTNPDYVTPPALGRDRRDVEFICFDITPLLQAGRNQIRIGLYKDAPEVVGLSQQPFAAFDGQIKLSDGSHAAFASGEDTRCCFGQRGVDSPRVRAAIDGPIKRVLLPAKRFRGSVLPGRPWFLVSVMLSVLLAAALWVCTGWNQWLNRLLERLQGPCGILAGWIAAALLARSAMMERSEEMYWRFPAVWLVLLILGITGAVIGGLLKWKWVNDRTQQAIQQSLARKGLKQDWRWQFVLALNVALCFGLRAWQIDIQPPDEDEYVSIQASLAVAKTGTPEFQEGVWYTRSPAYHYLAGAVSLLTGSNTITLRLLSVVFSCLTAWLVWKMAKDLMGNRFAALCALILFSIHPFEIFTGHVARFYQQQQFFSLLGLAFFLRGFVTGCAMKDRYLTVVAFFLAVLSQEITLLQVVPLTICYALFAQRRPWPDEVRLLIVAGCALALVALDLLFFKIECLTALDGISPRIDATIGWSFDKPMNYVALLVGYSRLHVVMSAFLIPGFFVAWGRKQTVWICLHLYFALSVIVTNLLITSRGYRFEYFLIPVWVLLCIKGMLELARLMLPKANYRPARMTLALGWTVVIICSWSPWRILASYDRAAQADSTRALRFVSKNLRVGDKIAISELYPQAALLETGQSDYDIADPILYDFALRKEGKLIDRNAGAEVIGNVDELRRAFAKSDRVWVVFDREQMHSRQKDILWEYPAGRLQLFLRSNARLVFRSYLWSVYLWDRTAGQYSSFREKPDNWFE